MHFNANFFEIFKLLENYTTMTLSKTTVSKIVSAAAFAALFFLATAPLSAQNDDEKQGQSLKFYLSSVSTDFTFYRLINSVPSEFSSTKFGVAGLGYAWQRSEKNFHEVSLSLFLEEKSLENWRHFQHYTDVRYELYRVLYQKGNWKIAAGGGVAASYMGYEERPYTSAFFPITYREVNAKLLAIPRFSYQFERFALEMNIPLTISTLAFHSFREQNPAITLGAVSGLGFSLFSLDETYQLRLGLVVPL